MTLWGSIRMIRAPVRGPVRRKLAEDLATTADRSVEHGGAWRSLVAHLLWEQRVGGSNPSAPTIWTAASDDAPVAQPDRASAF